MKENKKKRKGWIVVIIAIIVIVGAVATSGGKEGKTKKVSNSTSAAESKQKVFNVGDTIELKNLKVTINNVYKVESTNEFSKPKEGNQFLAVDCTLENISDKDQAVSSIMMFKVVDGDGIKCKYSLTGQTAANAGQLDGTIGVGRKLSGVYVVEVEEGKTGLELEFDLSFISGQKIVVKLN